MANQQKQPFESTLQDLVYSLDSGSGLKFLRVLLFCFMTLVIVLIFTANQFKGLDSEAAMDSAQLGRNLAEMNRYVTRTVRPMTIARVSANTFDGDARIGFHPELIRPPGYPAILAGAFKFFDLIRVNLFPTNEQFRGMRIYPAEQWVIIPINHFFALLTGLMLYFTGRFLFSHKIGLLGVISYFLSAMVWQDSIHGSGIPVLTFLVISAFYFMMRSMNFRRERRPKWQWWALFMVSVFFSAGAFLTHYAALAVLPGIALFVLIMGTRAQRSGHLAFFYLLFVFLAVSPWLLRNYQLSGSLLGLAPHLALAETAAYPDDTLARTLNPEFNLISGVQAVRSKLAKNFNEIYLNNFTSLGGGLLMAFFMITFFYRFVRVHVHKLRWGIGLSMLLFFIGAGCFSGDNMRLFHMFWPFVILYGLAFFSILLDRLDITVNLYKTALTGLVVGLTALPLLVSVFFAPAPRTTYPPYYVPFIMRVSELLRPTEIMCTDMPWATSWYGRRVSILLPRQLDEYYEINDYRKYISGLYITTLTKDRPLVSGLLAETEKTWFPITMGKLPKDFPLRSGFQLNEQDQLFLTDGVRWGADDVQRREASGETASASGPVESAAEPPAEPAAE